MLSFRVHQLLISGRHYVLLPKLNSHQMGVLAERLTKEGLRVRVTDSIFATSSGETVHIEPSGICWSTSDPADLILPAIPDVLASPKESLPTIDLQSKYFTKSNKVREIQLFPRIDVSSNWETLRAEGECGLAPDEHLVTSFLLERARGSCLIVTDFPVDGSRRLILGRRRYFESNVLADEVHRTLRVVGKKGVRNSYLPKGGALSLGPSRLSSRDIGELVSQLGEWCYFTAT
jgi:hypothetical protein